MSWSSPPPSHWKTKIHLSYNLTMSEVCCRITSQVGLIAKTAKARVAKCYATRPPGAVISTNPSRISFTGISEERHANSLIMRKIVEG